MANSEVVYLDQLRNPDANLRRRAVRELTRYPENKEVVAALCEALGDPNKGVQNITIEALSSMVHENVVLGLINVVKSPDLNTRNAGMTILRNLGSMGIEPIIAALNNSSDVDEIIQLLVVLGDIKSHLATDTVLKFINHEDDNVKTTAVESLGKIQDPKAVASLLEVYKNTDILRYSVVEALGNIAVDEALPTLKAALDSADMLEYFTAIGALGSTESPKVLEVLLKKIASEEDSGTRRLLFKSLAQIESANAGALSKADVSCVKGILLELLEKSQDAAEYRYLVEVAAAVNDADYANSLLDALQNNEEEISNVAYNGLCKLGNKAEKAALERINKVDAVTAVKILNFFEKYASESVVSVVADMTTNANDSLRQALAKTLGACKCEKSFAALKQMLNDVDETVRKNAVVSMSGMLDFDGAIEALIGKFNDINGHVRREACNAMGKTGSATVVEPLFKVIATEPYGDVREAAASVLASRKDDAITAKLIELLDNQNSRIRETVAKIIWQCGSEKAVESLKNKLQDSEWRVVVNACYSLEKMENINAIFALRELLANSDWQIRIAALSALRAYKSKEFRQYFIPMLADENPQVAKLAVVALSETGDKSIEADLQKHIGHSNWEVRYQIVKALGTLNSTNAADLLAHIVENDASNAVRSQAILTLAALGDKSSVDLIYSMLDNEDKNLVVSAIKYFKNNPTAKAGLADKVKDIFSKDNWIRNFFINTFAQNKSELVENALKAVIAPRQARYVDSIKNVEDGKGMNSEEALLLKDIIAEKCGIEVKCKKVLEQKLSKNLAKFFITSWTEYYHALRYGNDSDILTSLYDSITNPATEFFGEAQQTSVLVSNILPEIIEKRVKENVDKIRILCCGSSFGPEAYSVALSVIEDLHPDRVKVEVTGIDISHICLNTAKRGIYKREIFRSVDQKYTDLYFEDDRGDLRVKDEVKNMVEFKFTNALSSEAMEQLGEYDVVICRNLFSDFSQKAKERMAENIYNVLVPGGVLLIAGKESLYNVTKAFRLQTFDKVVAYKKL